MKALMRLGAVLMVVLVGCVTQPEQRVPAPDTSPKPPAPSAPPVGSVPGSTKEAGTPRVPSPLVAPTTGGVAYYQERQEQQLRERIQGSNIRVLRNGDTIRLVLPGNAAFATGDQVQPRFADYLSAIALVLKEYRKTMVDIRGYTDSTGSFEHNQQLSLRRAQAVGNFLTGKQVAAARIRTAGYGPRYPVADNKSDVGRLQNRRVEIDLVPIP